MADKNGLTKDEKADFKRCERIIEKGLTHFMEVGNALKTIQEGKYYRHEFSTFDLYLEDKWGFTRQRADQLIKAAAVTGKMSTMVDKPCPSSERVAREVAKQPEEKQAEVWEASVETAPKDAKGEPKVTAAHVASTARSINLDAIKPYVAEKAFEFVKTLPDAQVAEIISHAAKEFGTVVGKMRNGHEPAAPQKNGAPATFDDSLIEKGLEKIMRHIDDRARWAGGQGPHHKACMGAVKDALAKFKEWKKAKGAK